MTSIIEEMQTPPCEIEDNTESLLQDIKLKESSLTLQEFSHNSKNMSEQVLNSKIFELELNKLKCSDVLKVNGDGSDSGVEISGNGIVKICGLQRALSSNSGGYSSSCGGLEEVPNMISCDSSMISYTSDLEENKLLKFNSGRTDCCTSEGGSESSSITGGPVSTIRLKKKVALTELPNNKSPKKYLNENQITKARSSSVNRINPIKTTPPVLSTKDRARSRDKITQKSPSNHIKNHIKKPPKPDSFPVDIKDPFSPAIQRILVSRTPSITRGRTPGTTPTDDGRWPSIGSKGGGGTPKNSRGLGIMNESFTLKTRAGAVNIENSKSTFDKYATLPRRRKEKSAEDLKNHSPRSNSITRDNRSVYSTMKKLSNTTTPSKSLPQYPKTVNLNKKTLNKTKIYHETTVQTAITMVDIDTIFPNAINNIKIDAIEMKEKSCQSDIRDKEIENSEKNVKKLLADVSNLQTIITEKSQIISQMEKDLIQEREEKLAAQKELHSNSERVLAMLESVHVPSNSEENSDSLLILESRIMKSEHVLGEQEREISKWQRICACLQNDMEKSLRAQRNLIQQRDAIELESHELQDFLQAEKTTLADSLLEIERENLIIRQNLQQKELDLERLQDECRHLVRISEQRRQENMGLQSKYSAFETCSRDLMHQHGTAVSGASVALGALASRLDSLVEQLITSYSISERELEDVIFHNEAYTNSGSSGDGSPDYEIPIRVTDSDNNGHLSPQRGHSFIAAVINAIKNATLSSKNVKKINHQKLKKVEGEDDSDATEMLDSETEPCLMMENVLEDVSMPDSHSHNLVSTSGIISSQNDNLSLDIKNHGGESFHNLSQAIENRQQIEFQTNFMANRSVQQTDILRKHSEQSTSEDLSIHESIAEIRSITEYNAINSLVDQVIDVDNLVTRLLKTLRIIQMDNDNCIQQLIRDKNQLQLNKEETLESLHQLDEINLKLKDQLKEASQNIAIRGNELVQSKTELQKHRAEIDRLNEDICNLSTLCSQNMANSNKVIPKTNVLANLKTLEENGAFSGPDISNYIISACKEIPIIQENLNQKEKLANDMTNNLSKTKTLMSSSWNNAVFEAKRQYDTIDRALETLNNIQEVVTTYPVLVQLQRDLEESNFHFVSSLPFSTPLQANTNNGEFADFNANDDHGNGKDNSDKSSTNNQHSVDSTA